MDLVGVTASAATLIEVTGAIATTITTIVNAVRTADARLTSLSIELSQLTRYLQSVHNTLEHCRAADLSLIEDELWRHSEICLAGCRSTLDELDRVVTGVKNKAQKIFKLGSLGWKSRAAIELGLRGPELECFRERLYKSNSALQTMLHTINVSLSIRTNASQNSILLELSQLKTSIENALYASTRSLQVGNGGRNHANAARNLRELASVAQSFHSAASSTAGTVRGDNGSIVCVRNDSVTISNEPWYAGPDMSRSIQGYFPPERRERVEMYIQQGRGRHRQHGPSVASLRRSPSLGPVSPALGSPPLPVAPIEVIAEDQEIETREADVVHSEKRTDGNDHQDDDDDDDFERACTEALRQLALDRIKMEQYEKAVQFLHKALKRSEAETNDNADAINKLQIQLALCYILQGTWILADPLIKRLATTKCGLDMSPLLHAVTLGHLAAYSFDSALTSCKLAIKIQKRRCKPGQAAWDEYPETMGLLATIYDMIGEGIRAEVVRSQLPRRYVYQHPSSEVEFMKTHVPSFLATWYHELDNGPRNALPNPANNDATQDRPSPVRDGAWDAACDVTQLRTNWSRHERLENDTGKEVVEGPYVSSSQNFWVKDDADDECSPLTPTGPQPPPLKRRVTQFFRGRRHRRLRDTVSPAHQVSPITILTPQKSAMWWRALKLKLPKNVPKLSAVPPVTPSEEIVQGNFGRLDMERGVAHDFDESRPVCPYEPSTRSNEGPENSDTVYHEMGDSSVDLHTKTPTENDANASTETHSAPASQKQDPSPRLAGTEPSTSPTVYQLRKRRGLDSIRVDTETARTMASQARHSSAPAPLLSNELGEAIRELVSIYCELPTITGVDKTVDVESALFKIQELQELRNRFIALSMDSTMVMDIEGAIRRLEVLVKPYNVRDGNGSREAIVTSSTPKAHSTHASKPIGQGDSDSTYESAETPTKPGRNRPLAQISDDTVPGSIESEHKQPSPLTPSSNLSRQPSFQASDDSSWWMARAKELEVASQQKGKERTMMPRRPQPPGEERLGVKTYEGVWIGNSNMMKRMNGLYGRAL